MVSKGLFSSHIPTISLMRLGEREKAVFDGLGWFWYLWLWGQLLRTLWVTVLALPIQHLPPLLDSEPTLCLGEPLPSELSLGALWEGTHFISPLQKQDDWNVWACTPPPPPPLATGGCFRDRSVTIVGLRETTSELAAFGGRLVLSTEVTNKIGYRPGLGGSLRTEPAKTEQSPVTESPLFEFLDPIEPEAVPAPGYSVMRASKCPFFA